MDSEKSGLMKKTSDYILAMPFKMVAFCAVAIFLNIYVVVLALNYVNLTAQETKYEHWKVSGIPEKCEALRLKCSQESYKTIPPKIDTTSPSLTLPLPLTAPSRVFDESMYSSCVYMGLGNLECNVAPPQTLVSTLQPAEAFSVLIVIFASLVGVVYSLKCYFSIKHIGWRRITVVVAPLVSAVFISVFKDDVLSYSADAREVFVFYVIVFFVCIALPYLGAHFYKWIREGFASEEEASSFIRDTFVTKEEIVPNQLTQEFIVGTLKVSGVFCFLTLTFLMNPEKTLQNVVATLVQGVLLVGVVYLYRKFKPSK